MAGHGGPPVENERDGGHHRSTVAPKPRLVPAPVLIASGNAFCCRSGEVTVASSAAVRPHNLTKGKQAQRSSSGRSDTVEDPSMLSYKCDKEETKQTDRGHSNRGIEKINQGSCAM